MASKRPKTERPQQNREQQLRRIAQRHDLLIEELSVLEQRLETALDDLAKSTSADPSVHSC